MRFPGTRGELHLSRRSLLGSTGSAAAAAVLGGAANPSRVRGAQSSDDAGSTLTIASNWPPVDLDPHSAYDPGSGLAMTAQFEGLIKLSPGMTSEFMPSLAESWESNADRSTWTFHIRPGVTFHDGTPVDAEAARQSFERLFALGLAPSTVLGRFISSADQISASDPMTLVFQLGRPQPMFEAAMATAYGTAIVNAALAKIHEVDGDWGHAWAQADGEGLGTGPYRITARDPESVTELERFDGYWAGWEGDHFDHVVLRLVTEPETRRELIERGDVDIIQNASLDALPDLSTNPDIVVERATNLDVRYLAMTIAGALANPNVRCALCWAFPYQEVLDGVLLGFAKPARGPVNENCRGFAPTAVAYATDLDRASQLLDDAGIAQGTTLSIANPSGNTTNQAIAELFQANLAKLGIELDIVNMDNPAFLAMAFGDLPADERVSFFPASWGPDYDDAYNHLWPQVSCDAWFSGNAGHYCNDQVEQLLTTAREASDEATYDGALAEVQRLLTDDDPAAIYFAQPEWVTVRRADINGYVMNRVLSAAFDYYALSRQATDS